MRATNTAHHILLDLVSVNVIWGFNLVSLMNVVLITSKKDWNTELWFPGGLIKSLYLFRISAKRNFLKSTDYEGAGIAQSV
jgi:hypothetical protein